MYTSQGPTNGEVLSLKLDCLFRPCFREIKDDLRTLLGQNFDSGAGEGGGSFLGLSNYESRLTTVSYFVELSLFKSFFARFTMKDDSDDEIHLILDLRMASVLAGLLAMKHDWQILEQAERLEFEAY